MNSLAKNIKKKLKESKVYLKNYFNNAKSAVIFGSGLSYETVKHLENKIEIPYNNIPGFYSKKSFHRGTLIFANLENKPLIILNGRFHYYEGMDFQEIGYPVHFLKESGIENLLVTSSVGGINKKFKPGDLMLVKDHINLTSLNPLIGYDNSFGERFLPSSDLYSKALFALAKKVAKNNEIELKEGVMFFLPGPSFETPAEFNAIKKLGGDSIGWSTIPEVILANYLGMRVLAINCITDSLNLKKDANLKEILKIANKSSEKIYEVLKEFVKD